MKAQYILILVSIFFPNRTPAKVHILYARKTLEAWVELPSYTPYDQQKKPHNWPPPSLVAIGFPPVDEDRERWADAFSWGILRKTAQGANDLQVVRDAEARLKASGEAGSAPNQSERRRGLSTGQHTPF